MCGQWKQIAMVLVLCSLSALTASAQQQTPAPKVTGNIITFADGRTFQVDEVFKQGDELWYRKGNITAQLPYPVKSVKPIYEQPKPAAPEAATTAKTAAPQPAAPAPASR